MAAEKDQLFDCLFHIELVQEDSKLTPRLKYQYPPGSQSNFQSIMHFCFPDVDFIRPESKMRSETFSFVLTETNGDRRFGYCRRLLPKGSGKRYPECFCITSFFPCFAVFNQILDEVESRSRGPSFSAVTFFVQAILEQSFPEPGQALTVSVCSWDKPGQVDDHSFLRPSDNDSMLEHVTLEPLLNALDPHNLLLLFGALLVERRIIFVSSQLSHLSACVQSAVALLYPFTWQHVYIPVLPPSLLTFCCAPMPFVVGVLESSLVELSELPLDETLIVDLDENRFLRYPNPEAPEEDYERLDPFPLSLVLRTVNECRHLCAPKKGKTKSLTPNARERLTTSFLKFTISQIFEFQKYVLPDSGFDKAGFIQFHSPESTELAQLLVGSQMFEQFVQQTAIRGLPRNSPIARWYQWYQSVQVARKCEEQTTRSIIQGITSSTPSEKVLKEGWLRRYTHKLASETSRYFVMTAGGLLYYSSDNLSKGVKGAVPLPPGTTVTISTKLEPMRAMIEVRTGDSICYFEPGSEDPPSPNDEKPDPAHQLSGFELLLSWYFFFKAYVETQPTPKPPAEPTSPTSTSGSSSSSSSSSSGIGNDSPLRSRPISVDFKAGQLLLPNSKKPFTREIEPATRNTPKLSKKKKKERACSTSFEVPPNQRTTPPDFRGPLVTAQDLQKIRAAKDSIGKLPQRPPLPKVNLSVEIPRAPPSPDRAPIKPFRPEPGSPSPLRSSPLATKTSSPPMLAQLKANSGHSSLPSSFSTSVPAFPVTGPPASTSSSTSSISTTTGSPRINSSPIRTMHLAPPASPPGPLPPKPPKPIPKGVLSHQTKSLERPALPPIRDRTPVGRETKRPLPEKPKHATISGAELMAASSAASSGRPLPPPPVAAGGSSRPLPTIHHNASMSSFPTHSPTTTTTTTTGPSVKSLSSRFQ